MGIAINITTDNGRELRYGRLTEVIMDFQSRETQVIVGGYSDCVARQNGEPPTKTITAQYVMPDPVPENIVTHAYAQLIEQHPEIDFTEV